MRDLRPELLMDARRRLETAPWGHKSSVVEELAAEFGLSASRVREQLKQAGWGSGRKTRSDRGTGGITQGELEQVAAWFAINTRASGKQIGRLEEALDELYRSGRISEDAARLSVATWRRHLHRVGLSRAHLEAPSLATEMDSPHPNWCHMADASTAILFYLNQGKMEFRRFRRLEIKSKLQQFMKEVQTRQLLIRWLGYDHYSGSVACRYVEASGERATDLVDFLHYLWSPKGDRRWPFHGAPSLLYLDQGAAGKSSLTTSLCAELGVRILFHQSRDLRDDASAARATGGVEAHQEVWEQAFESQWRFSPPTGGIEQLNRQAHDFAIRINSDPAFSLRRTNLTRSQLWMDITAAQLRTVPADLETFRSLAVEAPIKRTIDNYGVVTVDGQSYKIPHCTWVPGEEVELRRNPWQPEVLRARCLRNSETAEAVFVAQRRNGRRESAAYIGMPEVKREGIPSAHQPRHAAARLRVGAGEAMREKTGIAAPGAIVSNLEAHADRIPAEVVYLAPTGTPILSTTPTGRRVDDWDVTEMACDRLGRALQPEEIERIRARLGGGRVYESEAIDLIEELASAAGENRRVLPMKRGA